MSAILAPGNKIELMHTYLRDLQNRFCKQLEEAGEGERFIEDAWSYSSGQGGGWTRVMENAALLERAGVNVSHICGEHLPAAATQKRPDLAGYAFEALGLSTVIHPRNPYVPTAHANVRLFVAEKEGKQVWWFGGGFDLTPYYGFEEDCRFWHEHARVACEILGSTAYPTFKKECDDYFYLKHRQETRGIGGLFFDDLNTPDFERCFQFIKQVGDHFVEAYVALVNKRKASEYGQRERDFQLYRRGRYVEFNLIYDRGTLFGLQSNGRAESILVSMPPEARWAYDYHPESGSAEERLYTHFLGARDW